MGGKRQQVKQACVNCQKSCKKCDDKRPCQRCIRQGIADSCIDMMRKRDLKVAIYSQMSSVPEDELTLLPDYPSHQFVQRNIVVSEQKFWATNLDALATICSEEFLKEKNAEKEYIEPLNRLHTHHHLPSDYSQIPRIIPTPPPTPIQSNESLWLNQGRLK
jgi:hypothetical protein